MNDPANVYTHQLNIKDHVTGNDFTVLGSSNLIGTDTEKKFGNASLYFSGAIGQTDSTMGIRSAVFSNEANFAADNS